MTTARGEAGAARGGGPSSGLRELEAVRGTVAPTVADPPALVRDVLAVIAAADRLEEMLQAVAQAVVARLDAAFARVWILDRRDQALVLIASAGIYTHLDGAHARVPVGAYKIGKIAADRRPHFTNDVLHDDRISDPDWARREGMVAFAGHPLVAGGELVGVMAMFAHHPLAAQALDGLAAVADAVAAGTRRLQAEARERSVLVSLDRIGRALVAELDLQRVVQTVTDSVTELTPAAFGAFFYNVVGETGESYMLYALAGAERSKFDGFPLPRNTAVFAPTFAGTATVRFDDVTAESVYGHDEPYHGMPPGHLPVRSYLAVPVVARDGEVLGGLFLAHPEPGRFDERDEALVEGIARYAAVAVTNARNFQHEQSIALTLQRALLPVVPQVPGVDLAVRYLPAALGAEVGGDWYDAVLLPQGTAVLTVGDVVGHGIDAAARMGTVRNALRVYTMQGLDPGQALGALDAYLRNCGEHALITALHGAYDPETHRFTFARAGHVPPLLISAAGGAQFLDDGSDPPLGVELLVAPPTTRSVVLGPGSALVLFTDGLVERRGADIGHRLEELRAVVADQAHRSSDQLCDLIVDRMVGPGGVADDIVVVALRMTV